jgi:hypothetical protein
MLPPGSISALYFGFENSMASILLSESRARWLIASYLTT